MLYRNEGSQTDEQMVAAMLKAKVDFEAAIVACYKLGLDVTWNGLEVDPDRLTKKLVGFSIKKLLA